VVFIKSIIFRAQEASSDSEVSFPDMSNDPFTPSKPTMNASKPHGTAGISSALTTKPMAPPTRSLVELPTCPVCLERMDESIGLLTNPCQHVFHCTCLQKWRGSGCPVCRYTQDDLSKRVHSTEEDVGLNECSVCRSDVNLWVCLICGNVGCGRYDAAHAFLHYKQTSHCFSMDLMNQRVWDYASDGYVHRIMQSKSDGKLVELPSAPANYDHNSSYDDSVPREKLDNISMEYTHLLTSQLESQRLYYEEKLERAADKASKASKDAAAAAEAAERAVASLSSLQLAVDDATRNVIPSLEKERDKANRRAERFEGMARKLEKEWREEKAMSSSLMERVEGLGKEVKDLKVSNEDLAEQNRDMTFFISGQEKLKGLGEEVEQGTVSLPEEPKSKRKGKGKKVGGGSSGS
jgi:BRCA1-associated protein